MTPDDIKLVHFTLHKYFPDRHLDRNLDYEDLVQIGSLALWESTKTFDPSKGKFSTYAAKYIFTAVSNELRMNRVKYPPLVLTEVSTSHDYDTGVLLHQLIKDLPQDLQTIATLLYRDKSHREIGEELGISVGKTSSRIYQIRRLLSDVREHLVS